MKHYRNRYFCARDNKPVNKNKVFKVCLLKGCNNLIVRKRGK